MHSFSCVRATRTSLSIGLEQGDEEAGQGGAEHQQVRARAAAQRRAAHVLRFEDGLQAPPEGGGRGQEEKGGPGCRKGVPRIRTCSKLYIYTIKIERGEEAVREEDDFIPRTTYTVTHSYTHHIDTHYLSLFRSSSISV